MHAAVVHVFIVSGLVRKGKLFKFDLISFTITSEAAKNSGSDGTLAYRQSISSAVNFYR
jgi:hypothetical protein